MTTNTILRQQILNTISDNTGISDVTPNSKIAAFVDSFLNEIGNIEDNSNTTVANMYIESADSSYLDKIGSQEGLSRIVNNSFKIDKATEVLQLEILVDNTLTGTISTGTHLKLSDDLYVVFLEDIDISLIQKGIPYYISGEVRTVSSDDFNIPSGSSYLTFFDNLYLKFNETITVPLISEEIDDFRSRVLYSRGCSKFGSEGAIRLCIGSTNYVNDYVIDYTTSPPSIYLYHPNLLINSTFEEQIELLGMNVIRTELNRRKADTTSYELKTPIKISFRVYLKPTIQNPRDIPVELYSLTDYFISTYKVGKKYSIDLDTIKTYLGSKNIDLAFLEDYTVTFFKVFNNFEYSSEDNTISLSEFEYPFLERILLTA